jgi:hypothetical protein
VADRKYLNFLGNVWDFLPDEDRQRMAETWIGYEQVFASAYQKIVENDINISLKDVQPYATERWLSYNFPISDRIGTPPIFTSTQSIAAGLNLSAKYLLKFTIDDTNTFEVDVRGFDPLSTNINEIVSAINAAAGFNFARTIFDNTVIQLVSKTPAPEGNIKILEPSDPSKDASEFILGLEPLDLPQIYPKFPHVFRVPYEKVVHVPSFRNKIRDESDGLYIINEGIDYEMQTNGLIGFAELPPEKLWAKKTFVDEETPWHNYGFLMDIYDKNSPNYVRVLQGLWYAFWTGPKPRNLQVSLYLLFGLPVALEDCTVIEVTSEIIRTQSNDGVLREFKIPSQLESIVTVGQNLNLYDPLVNGIEVFDKISHPGFIREEIGRAGIQPFLLDEATRGTGDDTDETKALRLLEEHTFLPQISVEAFVSPEINLSNVQTFLKNIKPLSKTYLFQVIVGTYRENLVFGENIGMDITLDVTPNLDSNQTTFAEQSILNDYELNDNDALNLDSDGVCMQEGVEIDVFSSAFLIDSFVA